MGMESDTIAYARAPLIEHNLHFEEDWRHANRISRNPEPSGWPAHAGIVHGDGPCQQPFHRGTGHALVSLPSSRPCCRSVPEVYGNDDSGRRFFLSLSVAMAFGTALYGFLGLLLSFLPARRYVGQRGPFSQRWRSGGGALSLFTCTSIPPGRMPTLLSPLRFSSGIGIDTRRTTSQWLLLGLISD